MFSSKAKIPLGAETPFSAKYAPQHTVNATPESRYTLRGEEQPARVGQIAEEIVTAYLLMILKLFICLI